MALFAGPTTQLLEPTPGWPRADAPVSKPASAPIASPIAARRANPAASRSSTAAAPAAAAAADGVAGRAGTVAAPVAVAAAPTRSFVGRDRRRAGGIGRDEEVRQGRVAEAGVGEETEELGVVVAAQRPGLELAEGDRVERGPRLGVVAAEAAALPGLEARHHEGQPALAPALLEPGVDARRVALQGADRRRVEGGQVALRRPPPAERPDEAVGVELGLPEELADAAGADVAEDLHLPHPLGGVHEPLGEEEVVGRVGVDVGDPRLVADHLDGRREPRGPGASRSPAAAPSRSPRRGGRRRRPRPTTATTSTRTSRTASRRRTMRTGSLSSSPAGDGPVPRSVPEPRARRAGSAGEDEPRARAPPRRPGSPRRRRDRPGPRRGGSRRTRPAGGRGVASRIAAPSTAIGSG